MIADTFSEFVEMLGKKQRVFCNNFSSIRVCEIRTSMVKAIKFLEDDVFIGETYDEDKIPKDISNGMCIQFEVYRINIW